MESQSPEREKRGGMYLTFKLAGEEYGLEILKVREIIGLIDITHVPGSAEYIRGVINLRGKVIPVVDLRNKFGMATAVDTDQTCIIVTEITIADSNVMIGIAVDAVSEVLDIKDKVIEDPPRFGGDLDTRFILGMARIRDQIKILLDIDMVLNTFEEDKMPKVEDETGVLN